MLFAVEGGGFFSASALGYSKGLKLLLLGRLKKEERPMRIAPWSHYQFVERKRVLDKPLATKKAGDSGGCASFACCRGASAEVDGPLPPRVGPINLSERLPESPSSTSENARKLHFKSSLKVTSATSSSVAVEGVGAHDTIEEQNGVVSCTGQRKVQWTDSCGRELVEIREFEPSDDDGSEDEFEHSVYQRCGCSIQ